jgi:hypothetical protein
MHFIKQSYISFANPKLHAQQFSKMLSKSLDPNAGTYRTQTVENLKTPEAVGIMLVDPKLFFSDPDSDPAFALILDSDPALALILDSDPALALILGPDSDPGCL